MEFSKKYTVRMLPPKESALLDDFLYEAIFVPEGTKPLPRAIIELPELQVYRKDFGSCEGYLGLVAETEGNVIGAVWARIMNDYGHIDDDTPSIAISLYSEYRGKGIGTSLMKGMLALLREHGYRRASLSVQKENAAHRLYQRLGFQSVEEKEEEYIMVIALDGKEVIK